PNLDLSVIGGAPGSGKSTLCQNLRTPWGAAPLIELSSIRNFHLDPCWYNQSEQDLALAFDHLSYILRSYARHRWGPVLVTDLREVWLARVPETFADLRFAIITLFTTDAMIRERIETRDEGFTNVAAAVAWNRVVRDRPLLAHEHRVDSSGPAAELAQRVEHILAECNQGA
ncbi:MAG TPA: AAA family ATPase, partial [Candidatus Binataceae bacterium]|nr:AAA family ATPase [Candidatus Binataceae bacterium]